MFIGHFGTGLAAKKIDNRISLGTLFLASQLSDLIMPILQILGIERVRIDPGNTAFVPIDILYYPFSHSLFSVLILALLFGLIYFIIKRNKKGSILLGGLVIFHWVLDLITHRPDLPLAPWSNFKVGFGLWNSVILTLIVESFIFITGAFIYLKTTKAYNKKGTIGIWSLLIFLTVIYLLSAFGPPPPNADSMGYVGLMQWLFIAWGYWIDRNRSALG